MKPVFVFFVFFFQVMNKSTCVRAILTSSKERVPENRRDPGDSGIRVRIIDPSSDRPAVCRSTRSSPAYPLETERAGDEGNKMKEEKDFSARLTVLETDRRPHGVPPISSAYEPRLAVNERDSD